MLFSISYYAFHKEIDVLTGLDQLVNENGKRRYYYWFLADGFFKVCVSFLIMQYTKTKAVSFCFFGLCLQNFLDEVLFEPIGVAISEIYAAVFVVFLSIIIYLTHDARDKEGNNNIPR